MRGSDGVELFGDMQLHEEHQPIVPVLPKAT
jgi:hypothetical protein